MRLTIHNPDGMTGPEEREPDAMSLSKMLFRSRVMAAIGTGKLDADSVPPAVLFDTGEAMDTEDLEELIKFRRNFDGITNEPRPKQKPVFRQERRLDD